MTVYWWLAGALGVVLIAWGVGGLVDRWCEAGRQLARLADPAPLPGELPVSGRLVVAPPTLPFAGAADPQYEAPFPDTGPLIIWSESAAAGDRLGREVEQMIAEAEQRIPRRWRR